MSVLKSRFARGLATGSALFIAQTGLAAADNEWFFRADINADGVVTPEEYSQVSGQRFLHLDRNGDGLIQAVEVYGVSEAAVAGQPDYAPYPHAPQPYDASLLPDHVYVPSQQAMMPQPSVPAPYYGTSYPQTYGATPYPQSYGATTYPQNYAVVDAPKAEAYYVAALGSGDPLALDTDGDGRLTLFEVQRYNDGNFARHDVDRNGLLTPEEWDLKAQEHFGYRVNPAPLQTLTEDTFAEHDLDNDGWISKYEWDSRVQTEFAILDVNRDGTVVRYEIAGYTGN